MLKIVESIAETGTNAIKLQTFKPETITLNSSSPKKELQCRIKVFILFAWIQFYFYKWSFPK